MPKKISTVIIISVLVLTGCQIKKPAVLNNDDLVVCTADAKICPDGSAVGRTGKNCEFAPCPNEANNNLDKLVNPIEDFNARITKKPFGIFINPESSPVQPEKFTGYHNGVDVEYQDIEAEVPVYAIANGTVIYSATANGYGGVVLIKHTINNQNHVAIYGHLGPSSMVEKNKAVKAGEKIGILGQGYSPETNGERKHLHFSLRLGADVNLAGYVKNKSDLNNWINPQIFFKN